MRSLPNNSAGAKTQQRQEHNFGTLDPRLIAEIGLAEEYRIGIDLEGRTAREYRPSDNGPTVKAILTDADLEMANQYSSPFESQNLEQKFPTLTGGLQTGQLVDAANNVAGGRVDALAGQLQARASAGGIGGIAASTALVAVEAVQSAGAGLMGSLESLKGKSAFTKINSTLIYLGTSPVKISATLFFRAWSDADAEVERQVQRLQEWGSPVYLSRTGAVENLLTGKSIGGSFFPSEIPPVLFLRYGGRVYCPLVIESISTPLVVERDHNADRLAVSVQVQFSSLTAWDKGDISKTRGLQAARIVP